MNCHQSDAEAGWEVYRSVSPPPSLTELNQQLLACGAGRVSDRMYRHYRRLDLHGYTAYLPINELDVRLKLARAAS